jgi:hypothetical protein
MDRLSRKLTIQAALLLSHWIGFGIELSTTSHHGKQSRHPSHGQTSLKIVCFGVTARGICGGRHPTPLYVNEKLSFEVIVFHEKWHEWMDVHLVYSKQPTIC